MAFPVIESVTETTFASDTTAHAVSMPASVNAGDALIVIFTNDGSATVTTPAGWTQLYTLANGTALTGGAYAKVASGSEGGGTVDFVTSATESASAQCYRISGWHGLMAGIAAGTAGSVTTGTTADPPLAFTRLGRFGYVVACNLPYINDADDILRAYELYKPDANDKRVRNHVCANDKRAT